MASAAGLAGADVEAVPGGDVEAREEPEQRLRATPDDVLVRDRRADHQLPRLEPRAEAHQGARPREAAGEVVADPQVV
jgi:hypothetical protein